MKGGDHFPLIQTQMTLKNISAMFHEAAKQLGHGDDAVLNLLKATTMPTELYGTLYGHELQPIYCHDHALMRTYMPKSLSLQQPQLLYAGVGQRSHSSFHHSNGWSFHAGSSPTRDTSKAPR